ncbi:MAG TPA: GNAT family protein [Bacteriovoracaceae bacterium]|nr:GNAT family protein [Bacteriovoracaceae bacterium]
MHDISIGEVTWLKLIDKKRGPQFLDLIKTNRNYLREWLGWVDDFQTISDIEKYLDSSLRDLSIRKVLRFWIIKQDQLVGIVHLTDINWTKREAIIGYWVGEQYRGQGLAEKATRAMINFAFDEWKLNRIEIMCATENAASQSIPVKLGFKREGILENNEWLYDHHVDHQVFSMLSEDWVR